MPQTRQPFSTMMLRPRLHQCQQLLSPARQSLEPVERQQGLLLLSHGSLHCLSRMWETLGKMMVQTSSTAFLQVGWSHPLIDCATLT